MNHLRIGAVALLLLLPAVAQGATYMLTRIDHVNDMPLRVTTPLGYADSHVFAVGSTIYDVNGETGSIQSFDTSTNITRTHQPDFSSIPEWQDIPVGDGLDWVASHGSDIYAAYGCAVYRYSTTTSMIHRISIMWNAGCPKGSAIAVGVNDIVVVTSDAVYALRIEPLNWFSVRTTCDLWPNDTDAAPDLVYDSKTNALYAFQISSQSTPFHRATPPNGAWSLLNQGACDLNITPHYIPHLADGQEYRSSSMDIVLHADWFHMFRSGDAQKFKLDGTVATTLVNGTALQIPYRSEYHATSVSPDSIHILGDSTKIERYFLAR